MPETLLLVNGRITIDTSHGREVDAMVLEGDNILGSGSRREMESLVSNPTRILDLHGKTVLPSFSDNLARIRKTALARDWIDLSNKANITEVFAEVEKECLGNPEGTWIRGYGWNMSQWGWHRLPHRADLDLVAPHHPVILYSGDFRIVWLNTVAIQESGVTHSTPHPPGGQIERDEVTGAATGIFKEFAADYLEQRIPSVDVSSIESRVLDVIHQYLSMGVTRLESFGDREEFEILREMDEKGTLPIEVFIHLPYSERADLLEKGWSTGTSFGNLRVGGLWVAVDGTLVSQTARLLEPYRDDWDQFGVEIADRTVVGNAIDFCAAHGFSPVFIASGDAACQTVLQSLDSRKTDPCEKVPQLVHGLLVKPDDLKLVENLNLTLTVNPRRIVTDKEVGENYLGARWDQVIDLGGWKKAGARIQFGSGEPLAQWSPLKALFAATSSGSRRAARHTLSSREGVVSMTSSAQGRDGNHRGWVVLSDDPGVVPPEKLEEIQVFATIYRGKVLFESESGVV